MKNNYYIPYNRLPNHRSYHGDCHDCMNYFKTINCYGCSQREECHCFNRMSEDKKERMYERFVRRIN